MGEKVKVVPIAASFKEEIKEYLESLPAGAKAPKLVGYAC